MSDEQLTPDQQRAREAWLRDIAEAAGIDAAIAARRKRHVRLERDGVLATFFYDGDEFTRASLWVRGGPSAGRTYRSEEAARQAFDAAVPEPAPTRPSTR